MLPLVCLLGLSSTLGNLVKDLFQIHTVFFPGIILGNNFIHIITDTCQEIGILEEKKMTSFIIPWDLAYRNEVEEISPLTWCAHTDSWLSSSVSCWEYKDLTCA